MSVLQGPCVSTWGHAPPDRPGLSPGLLISLCPAHPSRAFTVHVSPCTGSLKFPFNVSTRLLVSAFIQLANLLYFFLFFKIKCPFRASLVVQWVKRLPAMWETQVRSPGREDPLEKGMATHSSTLIWKIPWTEEPGRLQSMGLQRVRHN